MNGLVEVSSGIAIATAVMTYNGIQYEDSCSISIRVIEDVKEYYFEIWREEDNYTSIYGIKTDIPNFDMQDIILMINYTDRPE